MVGSSDNDLCILGSGDAAVVYNDLKYLSTQIVKNTTAVRNFYYEDVFPVFPDEWEYGDLINDYGAQPSRFL